jgi:hypothetical protein
MRGWTKRLLAALAIILFAIIIFCAGGIMLFKGTPDFYAVEVAPEKVAEAARRAESKLALTQNWAAMLNGDSVRASLAQHAGSHTPATRVTDEHEILISQDELNALFAKWSGMYGWQARYNEWIEQPRIVLRDQKLILAAQVKEVGAVVSFHFVPSLDQNGQLHLELAQVMAGRLPLPDAVWDSYKTKMLASLNKWIPIWQQTAKIDPQGAANQHAMFVTLGRLMLNASNHQPADPILFLPLVEGSKSVPVKLMQVGIDADTLEMKVRRLTPGETQTLAQSLRITQAMK